MVIGIIGENCSGKSTLAEKIKDEFGAEIVTGMDYLRLAKSEGAAASLFRKKLSEAVHGDSVVFVISEPGQIDLLPDGAMKVLVRADLETIKERFRARMRGNLPPPVEKMLERKHGMFDDLAVDFVYDGVNGDSAELCSKIKTEAERKNDDNR